MKVLLQNVKTRAVIDTSLLLTNENKQFPRSYAPAIDGNTSRLPDKQPRLIGDQSKRGGQSRPETGHHLRTNNTEHMKKQRAHTSESLPAPFPHTRTPATTNILPLQARTHSHTHTRTYLEPHVVALSSSVDVHEAVLAQPLLVAVILFHLQAVARSHGASRDQPNLRLFRPLVLPLLLVELNQHPLRTLTAVILGASACARPRRDYLRGKIKSAKQANIHAPPLTAPSKWLKRVGNRIFNRSKNLGSLNSFNLPSLGRASICQRRTPRKKGFKRR